MRDQKIVDAGDARRARGGQDPIGVASNDVRPTGPACPWAVSGIDEERLASRGHDKSGLPSFHIDEEDLEVPGGRRARQHEHHQGEEGYARHAVRFTP